MAIEGPLRELALSDVFQLLDLSRKTGVLTIRNEIKGRPVQTYLRPDRKWIGERRDRARRDERASAAIGAQQRVHLGPQHFVIGAQHA